MCAGARLVGQRTDVGGGVMGGHTPCPTVRAFLPGSLTSGFSSEISSFSNVGS